MPQVKSLAIFGLLFLTGFNLYSQNEAPHGDGFKLACSLCHSPDGWNVSPENVDYDHGVEAGFPLSQGHAGLNCVDCHDELDFVQTDNACIDCHIDVHESSVGNDCIRCHEKDNWLVMNLPEIHEQEGLSLLGAHAITACSSCHTASNPLVWEPMESDCFSCHSNEYVATQSPNHQQSQFSMDCAQCHDPFNPNWSAGNGFHLFFPLEGKHDISDCNACHSTGVYSDATSECASCHLDDYQATTQPGHVANTFSQDCLACHDANNSSWSIAGFHESFELSGVHDVSSCSDCHTDADFSQATSSCFSCHQSDFNGANNPDHVANGFSSSCLNCHTMDPGWKPATFAQHDQLFPIFSGEHQGEWNNCIDCHTTGVYALFSCIDCHEHDDANDLADDHDGVSGYAYQSTACFACHPDGSE